MRKRLITPLVISIFLVATLVFNYKIVKEVFISTNRAPSDEIITEFLTEESYQNILQFKNPFTPTEKIFYPFKINFALSDSSTANTLFFIFLRPFLDPYKSTLVIVLINVFLSCSIMYLLLRTLRFDLRISTILSLVYGFTPFLSYRINGHYTYTPLYLFPLTYLLIYKFILAKKKKEKTFLASVLGFTLAFTIMSNFQYFIIVVFSILFYLVYLTFKKRRPLVLFLKRNFGYLLLSTSVFSILLIPWLVQVINLIKQNEIVKTQGFGGAIILSSDLLNFFVPSEYNPFYKYIVLKLNQTSDIFAWYTSFFLNNWSRSAYPGLIILLVYGYIIFRWKKIEKRLLNQIKPFFWLSIFFALLSLGPFLKFLDKWYITLDEDINVYFPLPFLLVHYIPGLSSLRVPSRFVPGFVFFAVVASSYILNYLWLRIKNRNKQILILSIFFLIFLFDQFYTIGSSSEQKIPLKAYSYIKKDPERVTVFEIPFTARDGFQYVGFVHALSPMKGALIHRKPIIGGYIARIHPKIFDYYRNLTFIGYVARVIDKGNYDPLKEKPKEPNIYSFKGNIEAVEKEVDLLNIKYILLKNDEKYSSEIDEVITMAGFKKNLNDGSYDLYLRKAKRD